MKEELLHYIWMYQLYKQQNLVTTQNESIQILHKGIYNTNEGADFLAAKIILDGITLIGNIEIHINSSDWHKHQHHKNKKYQTTILHVVYNNDVELQLPTLVLNGRVAPTLFKKYERLLREQHPIACQHLFPEFRGIRWQHFSERLLLERLEQKKFKILTQLQHAQQDWLAIKYQLLFKYIGGTTNSFGFEQLLYRLAYKLLIKHADSLLQLEALLFGVAGFLETIVEDEYHQKLKHEFSYLRHKYQLQVMDKSIWNFLRMRPVSFPTIKLALLANIIHRSPQLFHLHNITDAYTFLAATKTTEYWHTHYQFGTPSSYQIKKMGTNTIESILINYSIPLYYTYKTAVENEQVIDNCIAYYQQYKPEKNHIVDYYAKQFQPTSSLDTQVLLELYNNYCTKKKCLTCAVGYNVLCISNSSANETTINYEFA